MIVRANRLIADAERERESPAAHQAGMLTPTMASDRTAATPRTWPFFVATLGFTWSLQLPAVLAQRGIIPGSFAQYLPLVALGGFGPLLAAMLFARIERRGGVRALFRPREGHVALGWYVLALFLLLAIHLAGMLVVALVHGRPVGRWLYPPENPEQIAAMVMFPLAEEPGWRGFALPRLQQRYGLLASSLIVGAVWAAWHTMMFIAQGLAATPAVFALAIANILVGSVLFGWLYHRTRGSLYAAILLHAGAHLNNPTHALPAHVAPFAVYTGALAATAIALVLFDRSVWKKRALD